MKFIYCYKIEWTQTDYDTVFIISTSNEIANKLKTLYTRARYYTLIGRAPLESVIE